MASSALEPRESCSIARGLPLSPWARGFLGAAASVTMPWLFANVPRAGPIRYCGQNSIVIYLAFFLPMAVTRAALLKFAPGLDIGTVALIVTAVGVVAPLILHALVKNTRSGLQTPRPAE